jgi:hypothetical protein
MKTLLPLVGMKYREPATKVIAMLPQSAKLLCVLEPSNPYDPNAILVCLPLGYIARGEAAKFHEENVHLLPAYFPALLVPFAGGPSVEVDVEPAKPVEAK